LVQCPRCAEPNHHGEVCGYCIKSRPAFDQVLCPYVYSGQISQLLHAYKQKPKSKGGGALLAGLLNILNDFEFDLVVPIPYHWRRLMQRGHNPVRELSHAVAQATNTPLLDGLVRETSQHSQQGLDRQQRLRNLHGAFVIHPKLDPALLSGKHVLLVDDVVTTGATCNSASQTLKQAGATSITIACLARTPFKQ